MLIGGKIEILSNSSFCCWEKETKTTATTKHANNRGIHEHQPRKQSEPDTTGVAGVQRHRDGSTLFYWDMINLHECATTAADKIIVDVNFKCQALSNWGSEACWSCPAEISVWNMTCMCCSPNNTIILQMQSYFFYLFFCLVGHVLQVMNN